jgi:transcriptional regulator with XRE-family HTH domain
MTDATKTFQAWLVKARKKADMTYAALAHASGLSTATIHGLENGETSPTLDTVEKLCKALGVSVEASLRVRSKSIPIAKLPVSPITPGPSEPWDT